MDNETRVHLYLSGFTNEVIEIDLLCKELTRISGQDNFANFAEELTGLTNDLRLIINGENHV